VGLKGTEDRGGGLSSLFNLQNGFNVDNGKMSSGLLFGRKAFVGLTGGFGTVTAGRQQDTLQDLVLPVQGNNFIEYFTAPGDVDNADGSIRNSNAVKWVSPSWGGVQVAAMYGFGGVAGSVGSGQAYNAAMSYTAGPLIVAAGYAHLDNGNAVLSTCGATSADTIFLPPVNSAYATAVNITRAGLSYVLGAFTLGGRYSYAEYLREGHSTFGTAERYNNGLVFVAWQASPALLFQTGYDYLKSHGDSSATYQQVTLAADYALSKRTDFYATMSYGHASDSNGAGPAQAVIADAYVDGGKATQERAIVGIRHRF